jgi:hypothetical protein
MRPPRRVAAANLTSPFDPFSQAKMKPIGLRIAEELGVGEQQVAAAISLLDGGAVMLGATIIRG